MLVDVWIPRLSPLLFNDLYMLATQEDNNFVIACIATYADIQAFMHENGTMKGCPLSRAPFLVDTSLLKARILGNTLAATAYGIAILLYFICLGHLRRRPTHFLNFKRKWGPYAYTTIMIGLSTAAFLQSTNYVTTSTSLVHAEQIHNFADILMACGGPLPILFIIWMADGLMVSNKIQGKSTARCTDFLQFGLKLCHTVGLYQQVQTVPRYFLFAFLGALLLISLGKSSLHQLIALN